MSTKQKLLKKLLNSAQNKSFTTDELDSLMNKCGCSRSPAGRGSGVKYSKEQRSLVFDLPHPGKELYSYQIKMVIKYLIMIGEISEEEKK